MAKFKKKPVVIEAFCLGTDAIPSWFMDAERKEVVRVIFSEKELYAEEDGSKKQFIQYPYNPVTHAEIDTLEGTMTALRGDFVIKGVQGEIYPCKPDIFELTYEEV